MSNSPSIWLAVSSFSLLLLAFRFFVLRGIEQLNPVWMFSIFNWIMAVGTFTLFDYERADDQAHVAVLFMSAVVFYITSALILRRNKGVSSQAKSFWSKVTENDVKGPGLILIIFILFVSLAVAILYFRAVGYNVLVLAIQNSISGQDELDFTTLRLESYSGNDYYAPGYVNQFKNILFPVTVLILFCYGHIKGERVYRWLSIALFPVALTLLLGTGQRGPFVVFTIIAFYSISSVFSKRLTERYRRFIIFTGIAFFVLLTFFQGRFDLNSSFLFNAFQQIIHRVFQSFQVSSFYGFRYVYSLDIVYGKEWMQNVLGMLPGFEGSDLSRRIHQIIFSSYRGTAPVSIWGSAYHNFGFVGVILFSAVLAIINSYSYLAFITGRKTLLRVILWAGLFTLMATWVTGSFVQLLNNGFLALLIFYLLIKLVKSMRRVTLVIKPSSAQLHNRRLP